jgi:hypothetical protein
MNYKRLTVALADVAVVDEVVFVTDDVVADVDVVGGEDDVVVVDVVADDVVVDVVCRLLILSNFLQVAIRIAEGHAESSRQIPCYESCKTITTKVFRNKIKKKI